MFVVFAIGAVLGLFIGMLSGLLGVGGGMIMLPLFRLAFGMSALSATATSLFTIIPTSLSGAVTHIRAKTCLPKLGAALGLGGACLSPAGVQLAQMSPSWAVIIAAALVIGYSSFTMVRKALKVDAGSTASSEVSQDLMNLEKADYAKAAAVGAVAGLASGYVGLGGGFIMVPLLVSVVGLPMRLASGTSLVAVMILATPATVYQCLLGNVDYLVGIAVACGSIPGAMIGARLVKRVPERVLRLAFAAFLGIAAILLVIKELGMLG